MREVLTDVVIAGAGISGLYTAKLLKDAGIPVIVTEARERVGGRTLEGSIAGRSFDLGGQWIGPGQKRINKLCKELGLTVFPQHEEGYQLLEISGKLSKYKGVIPKLPVFALLSADRAIKKINQKAAGLDRSRPWQHAEADALDRLTAEDWIRSEIYTEKARELIRMAVRAIVSAEPSEISMLFFLYYVSQAGSVEQLADVKDAAQQDRIQEGAFQIARRLAGFLTGDELLLNSPVRRIDQSSPDSITVEAGELKIRASKAVVALSPALTTSIEFSGSLNEPVRAGRLALARRMPMGSVIKVMVAYDRPFWRENEMSGMVVSDEGPFGPVFDACFPGDPRGYLVGFIEGEQARKYALNSEEERKSAVTACLVRWFGNQALALTGYTEKNWIADPYSGGCYTGLMIPGTLTSYGKTLREPCGNLHWAGTETATEWTGYFEGALEAAERVAGEICNREPEEGARS